MRRLPGHICWVGLMCCAFGRFLPAQSSLSVAAVESNFPLIAPVGQQSGSEANPLRAQDSKPDSQAQAGANPQSDPAAGKSSDPTSAPPPKPMLGITPYFENTNDMLANRRPLTVREKYILSLHQSFDVNEHIINAFQAALQQAANGQPHYGQGWGAYGERFAASEGDQITSSVLIYGVLPSILHEDPRYFRRSRGSMISRMWYAANRTFVTRRDNGTSGFNNSEIFGQLISCGISTSYYPPQDRTVSRVFSNWAVNLGGNSVYNMLSEYYPDVVRGLFHRHPKPTVPAIGN
jgi:hypothetical protein